MTTLDPSTDQTTIDPGDRPLLAVLLHVLTEALEATSARDAEEATPHDVRRLRVAMHSAVQLAQALHLSEDPDPDATPVDLGTLLLQQAALVTRARPTASGDAAWTLAEITGQLHRIDEVAHRVDGNSRYVATQASGLLLHHGVRLHRHTARSFAAHLRPPLEAVRAEQAIDEISDALADRVAQATAEIDRVSR